ncbi:hypothetical protein QQ045_008606 [Rhodiola kirilowii]
MWLADSDPVLQLFLFLPPKILTKASRTYFSDYLFPIPILRDLWIQELALRLKNTTWTYAFCERQETAARICDQPEIYRETRLKRQRQRHNILTVRAATVLVSHKIEEQLLICLELLN